MGCHFRNIITHEEHVRNLRNFGGFKNMKSGINYCHVCGNTASQLLQIPLHSPLQKESRALACKIHFTARSKMLFER